VANRKKKDDFVRPYWKEKRTHIPWLLVGAGAVGAVILLVVPFLHSLGWLPHHGAWVGNPSWEDPQVVVDEAAFEAAGEERRLSGVARNISGKPRWDLHITFYFRAADSNDIGTASADIPHLAAGGKVRFLTSPIPRTAVRWYLRDVQFRQR
jgi:hypothetical protein